MKETNEVLRKFVNSKSQFLDLKDGGEKVLKYISAEQATTHFQGKPVDCIRFHFEEDGKVMLWDRTSREFAKQMMAYKLGDLLKIRVVGQKNQTKYFITKLD